MFGDNMGRILTQSNFELFIYLIRPIRFLLLFLVLKCIVQQYVHIFLLRLEQESVNDITKQHSGICGVGSIAIFSNYSMNKFAIFRDNGDSIAKYSSSRYTPEPNCA